MRRVTELLQLLAQRECQAFRDPMQISGNMGATRSFQQRELGLDSIIYSRDRAKEALSAERSNIPEAKWHWDIVFHGQFPR